MDRGSPITSDSQQEEIEKVVHACAEACGVGRKMVEKICPASEEQEHRMDHHINTGSSYMLQVVLHCEGDLNQDFLLRVLNAMRFKNHVLRTRLIKHEGLVYQIILKDPLVYLSGVSLHGYLARNVRTPMDYGTPLARYAFIREPHGEAFFVWTVHCSLFDAWTLRLLFDDLQTACSDLEAYCDLPPRPPFGRYVRWLESRVYEAGSTFWLAGQMAFDNLVHKFPVLGPKDLSSTSTMKTKKLLHLPKVKDAGFSLSCMGHAAWALTIANLLPQENPPHLSDDVSFITMNPARKSDPAGISQIMGPISARVPLTIRFFPNLSIENLMRVIETQISSMNGYEHCAMKVLSRGCGLHNMLKQAVFNWNPPDTDLSPKRIVCHDKEAAPAVLAFREDLSVPFAHDYGLMFEIYEHGEHIAIYASWDQDLVSVHLVTRLFEGFASFLTAIMKRRGATVLELLSENRVSQSDQATYVQPQKAGRPPERLFS